MAEQVQEAFNINALALTALLILGYLTWTLPRRFAACPLLITTCLFALEQRIVISGLHFYGLRLILLTGVIRVICKGETVHLKWTLLDRLFLCWVIATVTFGSLSQPSPQLFMNRLGDAYNAVCSYFFFRCVIVNFEDGLVSVRTLAVLCIPLAVSMLVEKTTMYNPLSVLSGGPEFPSIRGDHIRCQGAFRHPILAGTFGASLIPVFAALGLITKKHHKIAIAGMASALIIAVTASSSGALMAVFAALGGLLLWKWRRNLRFLRVSVVVVLLFLALAMDAPVWYLFARLSSITGGEGWHRAWLIDQAIAHLDEWWLVGTTYTAHWGPGGEVIAADPNMMDITNHYIMEGVKGGLMKLGLFLAIIHVCFKTIGRSLRVGSATLPHGFFVWTLGVSLFVHCISFLSVPYFDQLIIVWYWLLAMICRVGSISDESAASIKQEAINRSFAWQEQESTG